MMMTKNSTSSLLEIESFELRLRRQLERIYGILFLVAPSFIWMIVTFFRHVPVNYTELMLMVYMSIGIGLITLFIRWHRFPTNVFLVVSFASIVLTIHLIQITGPQHNPFAHLFYPILLFSAIYFQQSGTFIVLMFVIMSHTICVVYGFKNDTSDEFLLTCLAYIAVTWITYLCKQTLMTLKENEVAIEVAGGIAHELSQPLLVIQGTADQLAIKKQGDESIQKATHTISENAHRMQKNLQQLQQITKYRSKKYVAGMKIIDLEQSAPKHE